MVGCISPQTATFLCTKHFFKSHNSNQTNVKIVFRPGLSKKCLLCATCTHFPRFQGTRPDHVQVRLALLIGNLGVLHMALDTLLVSRKSRVNWEILTNHFLFCFWGGMEGEKGMGYRA